ncbi:hypothetical protein [Aliikangiella sp. IMCC44632]
MKNNHQYYSNWKKVDFNVIREANESEQSADIVSQITELRQSTKYGVLPSMPVKANFCLFKSD